MSSESLRLTLRLVVAMVLTVGLAMVSIKVLDARAKGPSIAAAKQAFQAQALPDPLVVGPGDGVASNCPIYDPKVVCLHSETALPNVAGAVAAQLVGASPADCRGWAGTTLGCLVDGKYRGVRVSVAVFPTTFANRTGTTPPGAYRAFGGHAYYLGSDIWINFDPRH